MNDDMIRFSQTSTCGRQKGRDAEIIFENTMSGIRKMIVDENGVIVHFPGLAHPDVISAYTGGSLLDVIFYYSYIRELDDHYALIWQIEPDGLYWEDDDGFGRTMDDEINLYARLDENGDFMEPFRLYSIGSSRLFGTDTEEKMAESLRMAADPRSSLREHVPDMMKKMLEYIEKPEPGEASYMIPGTVFQADFSLKQEYNHEWFVKIYMSRCASGSALVDWLKTLPLEEQRAYLQTEEAAKRAEEKIVNLFYSIQREE